MSSATTFTTKHLMVLIDGSRVAEFPTARDSLQINVLRIWHSNYL
jgi:hypothetical protein